jgi:hypothetical protein
MSRVKIEAFLSTPPCSGDVSVSKLLKDIEEEFHNKVEVITYKGTNEISEKYNLTTTPALVIAEMVIIMGVCPSKETLISALREVGLE